MPEGPEIFYLSQVLKNKVLNKKIIKITSNTKTIRDLPNESKILKIGCKGKLLWIQTESYFIHLHMGISGWLVTEQPKIFKYILHFENIDFYLKDQRRFSKVDIYNEEEHNKKLDSLGIDVLNNDFTLQNFLHILSKTSKNISALLMEQSKISGIGNYIRNDALFMANIHPAEKITNISKEQKIKLFHSIRHIVFSNSIEWLNMDNFPIPSYIKKIQPDNLEVPYNFKIYGKKTYKGKQVIVKKIAGRDTYLVVKN